MRQPARIACILRYLVIAVALCFAARAHADDRSDARAHYQAGLRSYGSGDYQGAIREFSAAQQLVPADLNNYNLALCYDKLGDAEPAIQYYRAFLDKQPGTDKRAEIEASISRLEAASRSAAGKKAEARRADDARRAEDARRAARADETAAPPPAGPPAAGPVLGPAPPPTARPAPAPVGPPAAGPVLGPAPPPAPDIAAPPPPPPASKHHGPAIAGSIGPPSSAAPTPGGDAQLDRAGAISIDEIRDQRAGTGFGGPARRRGPAVAAGEAAPGQPDPSGQGGMPPVAPSVQPREPGANDEPPKEDPVYKKWWFWGIIAVTSVVVYELATSPSSSSNTGRLAPQGKAAAQPGGLTLLRW